MISETEQELRDAIAAMDSFEETVGYAHSCFVSLGDRIRFATEMIMEATVARGEDVGTLKVKGVPQTVTLPGGTWAFADRSGAALLRFFPREDGGSALCYMSLEDAEALASFLRTHKPAKATT